MQQILIVFGTAIIHIRIMPLLLNLTFIKSITCLYNSNLNTKFRTPKLKSQVNIQ